MCVCRPLERKRERVASLAGDTSYVPRDEAKTPLPKKKVQGSGFLS